MHGRRGDRVSQQLAAERAVNAFVHVVQELCVFIVVTCVNIEPAVLFTGRERRKGLCFVVDYSTAPRARGKPGHESTNCPRSPCGDFQRDRSPGARLSQPRFTSSFPITLTARLKADDT